MHAQFLRSPSAALASGHLAQSKHCHSLFEVQELLLWLDKRIIAELAMLM